jgi:M6 family metalloprotease-like protein
MVKYRDTEFAPEQTPAFYHQFLHGPGFPSARGYFEENSGNRFRFVPAGAGVIGPFEFQDDPETPDLDESLLATTRVIAGGGSILYANFKVDGGKLIRANNGGGGSINVVSENVGDWDFFKIIDLDGGELRYGDRVRLKTTYGHYVVRTADTPTAHWQFRDDFTRDIFVLEHPDDPANRDEILYEVDSEDIPIPRAFKLRTIFDDYVTLQPDGTLGYTFDRSAASVFQLNPTIMSDSAWHRSVLALADTSAFNFKQFDTNSDGVVTANSELSLLAVLATPQRASGGAVRWFGSTSVGSGSNQVTLTGSAAGIDKDANLTTLVHELSHLLGTWDLYGAACLSGGMTLMSCTIEVEDNLGVPGIESKSYHLDPWHKMRLGWLAPSMVDIGPSAIGSNSFDLNVGPVIVYDSSRGTDEFYIFEKRPFTTPYDGDATGAVIPIPGVAVWYIKTAEGTFNPVIIPSLLDADGNDAAVFSVGHQGTHVADPNGAVSRGTKEANAHNALWREGEYRLRWLDHSDSGARINITHPTANDWRLRVERATSTPLGGRLTQNNPLFNDEDLDQFGAAVATGDFNGDGYQDLAVGAPNEGYFIDPATAGAVHIFLGSASGLQRFDVLTQAGLDLAEAGDRFGAALAVGDFNNDGFADLAVGAPGESPGTDPQSGAAFLFRGSASGLIPVQMITQTGLDSEGNEAGDGFGAALVFGDLNDDGRDDLAVGAPFDEPVTFTNSGSVYIYRGGATGLTGIRSLTTPLDGFSLFNANFGSALAIGHFNGDEFADLVVGAPGKLRNAGPVGRVYQYFSNADLTLNLSSTLADPAPRTGDRFGAALAAADFNVDGRTDLAVGSPGRVLSGNAQVGKVEVFYGSNGGLANPSSLYQYDTYEADDQFGAALAASDFTGDGIADLAVGAPGEMPLLDPASGAVFLFRTSSSGLVAERFLTQSGLDPTDTLPNEAGDQFGAAIAIGDFNGGGNDVAVGAPGDRVDGFFGSPDKLEGAIYTYSGLNAPQVLEQLRGSPRDDHWYIRRDDSGQFVEIYEDLVEVQLLRVTGNPTAGTYELGFGSNLTTEPLPFNASGAQVQAAIRKLPGLENVEVVTKGSSPNFDHTIIFTGTRRNWQTVRAHNHMNSGSFAHATYRDWSTTLGHSMSADLVSQLVLDVRGFEGSDHLVVDYSNGKPFNAIAFAGGNDSDADSVRVIAGNADNDYPFTFAPVRVTNDFVEIPPLASRVYFSSVDQINVDGSAQTDVFLIESTRAGTTVRVSGNDGPDLYFIGTTGVVQNGDYDTNIKGDLVIDGGDRGDDVTINDVGDAGADGYTFADNTFRKSGISSGTLTYRNIEHITLEANDSANNITVENLTANTRLSLRGNNGADQFHLASGDYFDDIKSIIEIIGGQADPVVDTLVIHDQQTGTGSVEDYEFRTETNSYGAQSGRFVKQVGTESSPELIFNDLETLQLDANDAANTIHVRGTLPETEYTLNGNGGNDVFRVDAAGLRSSITVNGGTQTSAPGDTLEVVGTGSEVGTYRPAPASTHSGAFEIGSNAIAFTGLEPVTVSDFNRVYFVSPLSQDFVHLIPVDNRLRVGGTSTNPIPVPNPSNPNPPPLPPIPWEILDLVNVRQAIINLSENDDRVFQLGATTYLPVPHDVALVYPGALSVPGLESLIIGPGAGSNLVHNYTLTAPGTAPAQLLNLGGGPGIPAGTTSHLIYGASERLEIDHPSPGTTTTQALDLDGNVRARFADFAVRGGITVINPQSDVSVNLRDHDAVFRTGSDGRQLIEGATIDPLQIAAAADARLRLRTHGDSTLDFQQIVFDHVDWNALFSMGIEPAGLYHAFGVMNGSDSGTGSLRQAFAGANASPLSGTAVVYFTLPDTDSRFSNVDLHRPDADAALDAFVIRPTSAMPALTRGNTIVNGASQIATTGDTNPFGPEIVLDGSLAGAGANGLDLRSSANIVHGLNIQRFTGNGISIRGNSNAVTGNYVGTNATGDQAAANGLDGVAIVDSTSNAIGGTTPTSRNIISGNLGSGVAITGYSATGNRVIGNYIGTDATGEQRLPNVDGVFAYSAAAGNGAPGQCDRVRGDSCR